MAARGKQRPARDPHGEPLRVLSRYEAETLEAIAGRLLPTTETAGAVEAGAVSYIDLALSKAYQAMLPRYRRALREINRSARRLLGKPFARLSESEQDNLLTQLEADQARDVRNGAEFFQLLRRHVLEGVFGEPSYGGNRGMAGWRLVGFPGQRFGYPDPYINQPTNLPPIAWPELGQGGE